MPCHLVLILGFVVLVTSQEAGVPVINRNCNFATPDTCTRIAEDIKLDFNEMQKECQDSDLSMMPIQSYSFGNMRKILYFRYEKVTRFPFGFVVKNDDDRANLEAATGLTIANDVGQTGWATYDYNDGLLHLVPLDTKLPTVCWSIFKPRLQCPPNFKLFYPRLTCFYLLGSTSRYYTNDQCKEGCRALNANLGSFHSFEERQEFMTRFVMPGRIWTGTRFEVATNKRKGAEKEAIRAQAYNMDGSKWTNFEGAFAPTEPNGYNSIAEHCIELMRHERTYNDIKCDFQCSGCVCETSPDQSNVQY